MHRIKFILLAMLPIFFTSFKSLSQCIPVVSPSGNVSSCNQFGLMLNGPFGQFSSYQWLLNNTPIPNATYFQYLATASGSYRLAASNATCTDTSAPTVLNFTPLNVTTTPTGTVYICQGSSVTICTNVTGGATFQWYQNNTPIPGASNPCYVAASAGSWTVMVATGPGCSSMSLPINVVVNPSPVASVSPGGPIVACSANLPILCGPIGSGFNFQWRCNGVPIAGATGSCYQPVGSCNYSLVVTTSTGCTASSNTVAVTVNPTPTPPIVTSPVAVCQYTTAAPLTASGSNLLWYTTPTGGTGNAMAPTPGTSTVGSATWFVSQTTNGCESQRASIVVNTLQQPNHPTVSSPVIHCQYEPAAALAAVGQQLKWYAQAVGGIQIPTPIPNTSICGDITFYVSQTINGCESNRDSILVTTICKPATIVTASDTTVFCQGDSVTLYAPPDSGLVFNWQLNGQPIAGATDSFYTAITSGNYTVMLNRSGCLTPSAPPIVVTVNQLPATPMLSSNTPVCAFHTLQLGTTATGPNFLWTGPNSFSTTQQAPQIPNCYFYMGGSYMLTVTDPNGCSNSATTTVSVVNCPTGVQNVSNADPAVQISPNPSGSECKLEIVLAQASILQISVHDIAGSAVWEKTVFGKTGSQEISLPANALAPGVYIIEITSGNAFVKKLKWARN